MILKGPQKTPRLRKQLHKITNVLLLKVGCEIMIFPEKNHNLPPNLK